MINVVPAIKMIQKEIDEKTIAFNAEIQPLKDALKALVDVNEICVACEGKGKVLRKRLCAEDDRPDPNDPRDYIICFACSGSGRQKKL